MLIPAGVLLCPVSGPQEEEGARRDGDPAALALREGQHAEGAARGQGPEEELLPEGALRQAAALPGEAGHGGGPGQPRVAHQRGLGPAAGGWRGRGREVWFEVVTTPGASFIKLCVKPSLEARLSDFAESLA